MTITAIAVKFLEREEGERYKVYLEWLAAGNEPQIVNQ